MSWFKNKMAHMLSFDQFMEDLAYLKAVMRDFEGDVNGLKKADYVSRERLALIEKKLYQIDQNINSIMMELEKRK